MANVSTRPTRERKMTADVYSTAEERGRDGDGEAGAGEETAPPGCRSRRSRGERPPRDERTCSGSRVCSLLYATCFSAFLFCLFCLVTVGVRPKEVRQGVEALNNRWHCLALFTHFVPVRSSWSTGGGDSSKLMGKKSAQATRIRIL